MAKDSTLSVNVGQGQAEFPLFDFTSFPTLCSTRHCINCELHVDNMPNENVEKPDVGTPPPPYTPQRPPPPYALQNSLLETKENRGRVAPTPVHPRTVAQPVAIPSQGTGVNPAGAGPTTSNALSYTVKKADTAEPHEEFCPKCQCRIRTRQRFVTGKLTWFLSVLLHHYNDILYAIYDVEIRFPKIEHM
uniref:LITAF domain-containing protein n=1 Tax=Parascaris equorum TaxID=6256 RepID=A0A914RWF1_PAREQ